MVWLMGSSRAGSAGWKLELGSRDRDLAELVISIAGPKYCPVIQKRALVRGG